MAAKLDESFHVGPDIVDARHSLAFPAITGEDALHLIYSTSTAATDRQIFGSVRAWLCSNRTGKGSRAETRRDGF